MRRASRIALSTVALGALAIAAAIGRLGIPFDLDRNLAFAPKSEDIEAAYRQAIREDKAVFAAVLTSKCAHTGEPFVVSTTPTNAAADGVEHSGPFREAKLAMLRRSSGYFGKSEVRPSDQVIVPPQCTMAVRASEDHIRRVLSQPPAAHSFRNRPAFRTHFPGASSVTWLSMPGYSRDGLHAVVYISSSAGGLAASGFSMELEKTEMGWVVVGRELAWTS